MSRPEDERVRPEDERVRRLAEGDLSVLRAALTGQGLIPLSPKMLVELAQEAATTGEAMRGRFESMTAEEAAYVRSLRVGEGFTWRAVAFACHMNWDGDWEPSDNQLAGMAICERAAELLGEDYRAEPWN